jgi:hypothetical protein
MGQTARTTELETRRFGFGGHTLGHVELQPVR